MIRKLSLFTVFLILLQVLLPLSNVFATEIQAPANLKASQYYPGNIVLDWDKVTGVSSYRIYKIQDGQQELVKEVSYENTDTTVYNVSEGSSTFAVSSIRRDSESELSNTVIVEVVYPEMESPLNVVSSIASGNDLTISWDKVTYAADYNIYQVVDGTRTLTATTKTNSYTFVNHPEGKYSYEITSYNSRFGESFEGSQIEGDVVFPEIKSPIVTYKIENGNDLIFNWQKANYATNYRVYELVDGERKLLTTTRLNSHLISNVSEEKHVYEVTTYSDRFGESEVPFRIEIDMVFPDMQAPESLTYTLSNYNDINLRWTQAEYADSYKLYQVIDGEKKLILSTSALNTPHKNMPEGHYKYEVASYSDRFGESEQVANLEFDLIHPDMLAPENPTITVQNGNDLVLRWDAFEYATAYKVYQIINGERKLIATKVGNAHTMVNMPEGKYTFEITSYSDRFGESPTGSRIEYELNFPELQALELTGKVENENTIILDWTKEDNAAGYNVYQVIDGTKKFVGTTTSLQFKVSNQPEGRYIFEVTSYHSRFGESPSSNQVKLYIGPKLEAPKTSGSIVEDDSVTLNWGLVQNAESYNIYEVVNGELKLVENTTETSLTISDLEPGDYEYRVVPISPSGVESEAYSTIQIQAEEFDTTSPVTTSNITETVLKEDAEVQLTATDTQSGVNKTFYSINGSEFTAGTSFTLAEEGTHKVSFYSVDKAGNKEEVKTVEVKLDKTAPVTTSNMTDNWYKEEVEVQLTATDDLSEVDKTLYSIDGSEFQEGTSFTLAEEGAYKVSFYSIDKAGNEEEAKTIEVKVDKIAPETTSNATNDWSKEDVPVELTATDNASGVDKTYYSINGSDYVEGTSFTISEEGIHEVSFYSVDKAGNVEEAKTVEVKVDKSAPEVSWNLDDEYTLGAQLPSYKASDAVSGIASEVLTVNGQGVSNINLDQPGTYNVVLTLTDYAGWTTTVEKTYVVYIPATINVNPGIIKGNKGVFTVQVTTPKGFDTAQFDLSSAKVNGVSANTGTKGLEQQAKKGQFKFERENFQWNEEEVELEFRAMLDGYLVVGSKTVKVLAK
ncbi:fibronectin [Peribacillus asahii]|uniref:Fibronectin n=1 Tax=Peribacillus asahii TaxID=228899 RepID=A0A3Q9RSK5_9BACI|nr:hypothetical protein [Peribacillus asahii]AZV45267.1 fibronectin [Peribacillus asahii]